MDPINGMACPSTDKCFAVGAGVEGPDLYQTSDGGLRWTSESLPVAVSSLKGISCSSTSVCEAVGVSGTYPNNMGIVVRTVNGGLVWSTQLLPWEFFPSTAFRVPQRSRARQRVKGGDCQFQCGDHWNFPIEC